MFKNFITMITSLCMMFSIMPINAMAKEAKVVDSKIEYIENTEEVPDPSTNVVTDTEEEPDVAQEPESENEAPSDDSGSISNMEQPEPSISTYEAEETNIITASSFYEHFSTVLTENGFSTNILTKTTNSETQQEDITLKVDNSRVLELLSQQPQTETLNYQNWEIDVTITGQITLGDDFAGLGDSGIPFTGVIKGSFPSIKTTHTLFKSVSSVVTLPNCYIVWVGKSQTEAIFAEKLVLSGDYSIPMSLKFDAADKGVYSPFMGTVSCENGGSYSVTLPTLDYSNVNPQTVNETDNDIGLLCRVLESNTKLSLGSVTFPVSNKPVQFNSSANTGGLIGTMKSGSTLTINNELTLNSSLIGGESAGGLVGSMESGATINLQKAVNITTELTANNSGGIAGKAETETGTLIVGESSGINIDSVKANASENAGVLYGSCTVTGTFSPLTGVAFPDNSTKEVSGPGNCGGIFGSLTVTGNGKCTIDGTEDVNLSLSSTLTVNNSIAQNNVTGNTTNYGGIVGTIKGDARSNALIMNKCDVISTIEVGNNTANYPGLLGGVVALQQTATLDTSNSTISVINPTTRDTAEYGFGGICAKLDQDTLLIADSMIIKTSDYALIPRGGGVTGYTGEGSIVYLKKSLDLSECRLTTNANSGQIVGKQQSSLVYAPNVAINRLSTNEHTGMELDDIGNYGELYRIQDLIEVSDDGQYNVKYLHDINPTDGSYVLSSALDYACLALAWQSRGYFPTVNDINTENWSTLKDASITLGDNTLGDNIDMTDCGIGGLTRDVYSADDIFTGIFDGNGKTITLDIGATNVANEVSIGDGRIYWHNATGLFAGLSNNATVQNLILDGSIRLSNNRISTMSSGALAAQVNGSWTDSSLLNKVSTSVNYNATVNGDKTLYLGGLIGQISGGSVMIDFDSGTRLESKITITHTGNGSTNHFGGAIGGITGDASANISCSEATITGYITSKNKDGITNLYAGGLIGTILPSSKTRTISITNLTVNGFSLTGNVKERMGGILGGIWADTNVEICTVTNEETGEISKGLSVTGTTKLTAINTENTVSIGGLVYRASGKWTVSSVDLSGFTIDAQNASALGLMVCHGEPYKDPLNNTTTNINGLYLEMTQYWDNGYKVPTVNNFGNGVFDEFVAYTAYRDSSGDYDITHNGSGIISLKTENCTVNMGNEDSRNTYVNRTTVGQSKQTNLFSRYYYNLDKIMSELNDSTDKTVDTAKELLIWSVCRYADSTLRKYFKTSGISELWNVTTIGGTTDSHAGLDMKGLSYYPIDITNSDVTVQYADVRFYNNEIEEKEKGTVENKSTRGTDIEHTQHYMMHCGLFHDFRADNITENKDYTLTVNGVSFAGTVGVVNGGSGALVCGKVAGQTLSGNTSVSKVVLADDDEANKAVTLNGISVVPVGDYTPVLINKIRDYSSLAANYITTSSEQTMKAGSSLIGDVGSENASKLTVTFGGTIKLPENKSGKEQVFTKATLLNTLRYATGSAVYNFPKEKDYSSDNRYLHNATHGSELGNEVSVEYVDEEGHSKLGKYQGSEEYISKISNFAAINDFSNDLPYIAYSPATKDDTHTLENKWHELAVNLPSTDLIVGCGTYGHPYQLTTATFLAVANYINGGTPAEDWQISIPANTETYHSSSNSNDNIIIYKNGVWKDKNDADYTLDVREYLQAAYYQLNTAITLKNFNGLGATADTAFKGVIDGNGKTVTLTGNTSAFIKYSYGSVVRNLSIVMNQSTSITRPAWTRGTPEQAPSAFFGGVIGCVLGGDNIIDSVTVSKGDTFTYTLGGVNSHLIPVGGYIGVIAGGGVIFRGTYSNSTGITGRDAQLYRNPIIGRVLGGYAFYEGSGNAPNNGDKNYTINKITPTAENADKDLSWDGSNLIVNSNQGLLILSAIVSSGAGSAGSNAYSNGLARNAKYDSIGDESEPIDYSTAKNDAEAVWQNNNTPYLLAKYGVYTGTATICSRNENSGITIKFAENATFDMDGYGNGYRGLSARYVSNAAFKVDDSGAVIVDPTMVVLRVKIFDGQNAAVQNINMDVREYDNDDFHMASMGGIFNIVWTQKQSGGGGDGSNFAQNLTLQDCNVSLKYVNSNGVEQNLVDGNTLSDADGRYSVSVGGFIGVANDVDADSNSQKTVKHNYLFTNIHINGNSNNVNCKIYGPNGVGGLIGTTAMASTGVTGYPGKLLANGKWALFGPNFLNCSYSNIEVTAGMAAGGLIGDAYASGSSTVPGFSGLGISYGNKAFLSYTSCTVTSENLTVGANSTITARAKGSIAAGIFGAAGMRVGVNDPEVAGADKTNLAITGAFQTVKLTNVGILVSQVDYTGSNPDGEAKNAYAGGIIARIGSENPVCFYDVEIQGGKISSKLATSSIVGGIVGSGYTNKTNTMERCHINSLTIEGVYAGGFLGRGINAAGFTLYLSDCSIIDSSISGKTTSGYAGGVVGDAASNYYLYNLLMKNTSIKAETESKAGRLFGRMNINAAGNDFKVYAAGVSIFSDNKTKTVPSQEGGENKSYVGYIAYADYSGTEKEVENANSPYVTVKPNYTLTLNNGANKTIYGDAVAKIVGEGAYNNSVAQRNWADQKGALEKKNLVSYQNVKEIAENNDIPEVVSFKAFQEYEDGELQYTDFPVLVLKGGDSSVIKNYLNMIINNDYLTVLGSNSSYVTISDPKVYYYNTTTHTYSEATSEQLRDYPASIIKTSSNEFEVKTGSYDNTLNRFTLLEITFKTGANKEKEYTVSIPVVVERELQYDFAATFSAGTVFNKAYYNNLKDHILERPGTSITALISYWYNRKLNAYMEYDWQSYLDAGSDGFDLLFGGNSMDKILNFDGGLPAGTQLTLIDCQNDNKAYTYSVPSDVQENIQSVRLSEFKSADGTDEHFKASLGIAMEMTASEDSGGKYVRLTKASGNAVKLNDGFYYRLAEETDTGDKYRLEVPAWSEDRKFEENYYLIMTVPDKNDPSFKLNGNLKSQIEWIIPSSVTQVHRYSPSDADDGSGTESTYQIYSSYQQELNTRPESVQTINIDTIDKTLTIDVDDTISFDKEQLYTTNDKLYMKLTASLYSYSVDTNDNNKTTSTLTQFPAGTSGIVHFYIQNEDSKYYYQDENGWHISDAEVSAGTYEWTSNGANIELPLKKDENTLIDLSGVRTMIKGSDTSGIGKIKVTAKMDVAFGSQNILEDIIPASADGTEAYAKLHYVSRLSTLENGLDNSMARANKVDNVQYYRAVQQNATLTMDALTIDRLGINPLQLVEDSQETVEGRNASWIDMLATLDFVTPEKAQLFLENTSKVRFTLSLERRNGTANGEKQFDKLLQDTAAKTMTVKWAEKENEGQYGWIYEVPKEKYIGESKDINIFDGTTLSIPLTAYVYTDIRKYANYRLNITVSFIDANEDEITGLPVIDETEAYVVYTYACIKPTFYEPLSSN